MQSPVMPPLSPLRLVPPATTQHVRGTPCPHTTACRASSSNVSPSKHHKQPLQQQDQQQDCQQRRRQQQGQQRSQQRQQHEHQNQQQQHQNQQQHQQQPRRKGPRARLAGASSSPEDFSHIKFMQLHELQQLLDQQGSALYPSQLVAVLTRAAKLRPVPSQQQRDALFAATWQGLHERLHLCQGRQVVTVLWAAVKLNPTDALGVYKQLLSHLLTFRVLSRLEPRSLSTMVYAIAAAPAEVAAAYAPAVVDKVLPALLRQDVLQACNAQDVANIMWALGTLGLPTLQPLLSTEALHNALWALLDRLQQQDTVAPQGIANALWALARLEYPAPQPLLLSFCQRLLMPTQPMQARPAGAQDAANCLWALATLQQQQQQQEEHQQPAGQQADARQQQQQALQDTNTALQHCALQLLGIVTAASAANSVNAANSRATCHSLAQALWAVAKLGVQVPQQQLQQLLERCVLHSSTASTQDVANILWACANLHSSDSSAAPQSPTGQQHRSQQQQQLSQQQQQQQQQQQLSQQLSQQPQQQQQQPGVGSPQVLPQSWADALLAAAAAGADAAQPQAIANTLHAAAKMGLQAPTGLLKALVRAFCSQAFSGAATAQNIANLLWALAVLQAEGNVQEGHAAFPLQQQQQQQQQQVPQEVVQVLVDAFMQQLQHSNCQEVANTLWAGAKLQYCVPSHQLSLMVSHITGQQDHLHLQSEGPSSHMEAEQEGKQSPAPAAGAAAGGAAGTAAGAAAVTGGRVKRSGGGGRGGASAASAATNAPGAPGHEQQGVLLIKPAEAVGILWSIATMQHQQTFLQTPLLHHLQVQQLLQVVFAQQSASSVQEIAGACWAAARMQPSVMPAALLQQDTLAFIASQVINMNMQAVSNLAYALGQLGVLEAKELLVLLVHRALHLAQEHLSSSNGSSSNGSSSSSNSYSSSNSLSSSYNNSEHSEGPDSCKLHQAVPIVCWAAAVLGVRGQGRVLKQLAGLCSMHCWPKLTLEALNQLYMLHMSLVLEQQHQQQQTQQAKDQPVSLPQQQQQQGRRQRQQRKSSTRAVAAARATPFPENSPGGLAGCLTQEQLQECKEAWLRAASSLHRQAAAPAAAGNAAALAAAASGPAAATGAAVRGSGSALQRKVFVAACRLSGLRGMPTLEALSPDRLFSIDIQAVSQGGVQLAIEADGPTHFRLPDYAFTGSSLFRNRQLAARGYAVVSVAYTGWNEAVAVQQQQQRLQQQQQQPGLQDVREGLDSWGHGMGQQQQQQQGQQQLRRDTELQIESEGLLGVGYLQGLVDAAIEAAAAASRIVKA